MQYTKANFGNGDVRYISPVEPVSSSTEFDGNVTINTIGSPGRQGYFEVSFMIQAETPTVSDDVLTSIMTVTVPVVGQPHDAPYRQLESGAARQIAPALRSLADLVEAEVAAFDRRESEKAKP